MLDYNILQQDREVIIQRLDESDIGVIAGMTLGQSLFSKKIKNRNDLWYFLRTFAHFRENVKKIGIFNFLQNKMDIQESSRLKRLQRKKNLSAIGSYIFRANLSISFIS